MIRFDSDYLEGAHPSILQRLLDTNFEQTPGYGEDPHCAHAASMIRSLCGLPDAPVHFLTGGTQTNVTVISALMRPHEGVICATSGHINVHETGAVEHSGHKALPLPPKDGKISAGQVRTALEAHRDDPNREHCIKPGMVYISFPTELGTLYSLRELEALHDVCSQWNIPLFIDGARLGYGLASEGCDLTLKDIARLADVFYIGGTKQGALFGEAVVFRNKAMAEEFRYHIKQNGGLLAKGRLLGIQFEALIENGLYFGLAARADALADRIRAAFKAAGASFLVENKTNQVFPVIPDRAVEALSGEFGFEAWDKPDEGHTAVRFCTSWATTEENVEALEAALAGLGPF